MQVQAETVEMGATEEFQEEMVAMVVMPEVIQAVEVKVVKVVKVVTLVEPVVMEGKGEMVNADSNLHTLSALRLELH
jgi:hypothetical protein